MSDLASQSPCCRLKQTGRFRVFRVVAALTLLLGAPAWAGPLAEKKNAIAALVAAGLSWEEDRRAVIVTDEGRAKLEDLAAVEGPLRKLQPRSLDLSSCAVLKNVDGLRGLRALEAIYLTDCPALENVDGIAASDRIKKIYLYESLRISPKSLDAIGQRFPKCYLVYPDGTGINPPRDKDKGENR